MGDDVPPSNDALHAFPSPASVTDSLSSPFFDEPLSTSSCFGLAPSRTAGIVPSDPNSAAPPPLMSPPAEELAPPDMNHMEFAVGGALAPATPSRSRLRLPSFEELGIAAPHPDRRETPRVTATPLTGILGDVRIGGRPGMRVTSPVARFVDTLTPPLDHHEQRFILAANAESPALPLLAAGPPSSATEPTASASNSAPVAQDARLAWFDGAVDALLTNISTAPLQSNALKVISHALPSPSTTGHIFSSIIGRIDEAAPISPGLTWINVFHAIPGRFNLADLPTSPPATPGPAIGGEDYFTQKVFDSAVSVSDYQENLSSLPRSPRPIVPPSTIDVSIVERYIPPSTSNEFSDMFNPNGPSILVDRLVELSPNNGSLVFIYPTREGAQTFMRGYLSPIIDPILRTMVVVHGLSSDLSRSLGRMVAVDQLPDYDTLHRRVLSLCERLTQQPTAAQRFAGRRPHFTLSYASRQHVRPSRDTWSKDWWAKQEKPRVRDVVKRYSQEAQTKRSNEHVERAATSTELLQEFLKGVCEKPYPAGQEPDEGIEVSVFVIKRTE